MDGSVKSDRMSSCHMMSGMKRRLRSFGDGTEESASKGAASAARGLNAAEAIAHSILAKPAGLDNCTALVAIFDPACAYEQALIAGVFDGHFTNEVADFAVSAFRSHFLLD
jgi:hypothetical protein